MEELLKSRHSTRYKYHELPKHVYKFNIKNTSTSGKVLKYKMFRVAFKIDGKVKTIAYTNNINEATAIASLYKRFAYKK